MDPKIDLVEIPSFPFDCTAYPQGEFITGCTDVMIGKGENGSFFRLYYPTSRGDIKNVPPDAWTNWCPRKECLEGIGQCQAPCLPSIYVAVMKKMLKKVRSPVIWEAPIAKGNFPVVLFSHGLFSMRSGSTGLCSDIASYGLIVASVEHRDESACATMAFTPEGKERCIWPKMVSSQENEFELRKKQTAIRSEECSRALDILEKLNFGENLVNELDSNFELMSLKGRLDLTCPIITGYSFGGANAAMSLANDQRFKAGIMLDPWMFPIKDIVGQLSQTIKQPMLFILMQKFQTEKNLKYMKCFQNMNNEFYTIRKGNHSYLSDLPAILLRSSVITRRMANCYESSCSTEVLVTIINNLLKKFTFRVLGIHEKFSETCNPLLEKYESKIITRRLVGSAKTMVGWD